MNRISTWYILLLFAVLFVPGAEADDGYSYAGLDGLILSNNGISYYEEMDPLGRPSAGIRWDNGTVVEETTWSYHGDSQNVSRSVLTGENRIIETEYDLKGNILFVRETEKKETEPGKPNTDNNTSDTRVIKYTYDEQNRLRQSVRTEGDIIVTIRFDYHNDGSLAEKNILRNGSLSVRSVYRDEENWTETVYQDEQPLLTVVFENGQRKRMQYETW